MGLGHFCFEDKLYKLNKKKKSLTRKYFKSSGQWEKSEELINRRDLSRKGE